MRVGRVESAAELDVGAGGGGGGGVESGAELDGSTVALGRPAWSPCLRFGARFLTNSRAVVRFSVETDATDQASRSKATETPPAHSVTEVTFVCSCARPIQIAEFMSWQNGVRNSAPPSQLYTSRNSIGRGFSVSVSSKLKQTAPKSEFEPSAQVCRKAGLVRKSHLSEIRRKQQSPVKQPQ